MLKFSKKLLYAIEAVVDIAYNSGGEPVQIREVTSRQGVPQRYLEQVMQRLVKSGILKGIRGPRGGYLLGRERSKKSGGCGVRRPSSTFGGVGPVGEEGRPRQRATW